MARFIPIDKIKKLREAARNGDENAKKILNMQLGGEEDYSELLDSYFAPKSEPEQAETVVSGVGEDDVRLNKFLADNQITKDSPEYDQAVKEFYAEVGGENEGNDFEELIKKLLKEESGAIDDYSKAITQVMNAEGIEDNQKRRIIARFKEIRSDEEEHFRELTELLKSRSSIAEDELE